MKHAKRRLAVLMWVGAGLFGFAVALVTVSALELGRLTLFPVGPDETSPSGRPREAATPGPLAREEDGVDTQTESSRSRMVSGEVVRAGFAPEPPELLPPLDASVRDRPGEAPPAAIPGVRPPGHEAPARTTPSRVGVETAQALPPRAPMGQPTPAPRPDLPDAIEMVPRPAGRVTLRAEDQDVRQVLALLSRQSGVNLLVSPAVQGQIRVDLQDVTFKQALDAIVRLANLGIKENNGLLYIYTDKEMTEMKARARERVVRVYHLNYIRAADIQAMIRAFLSADALVTTTPPAMQGVGGGGGIGGGGGGAGPGPGSAA